MASPFQTAGALPESSEYAALVMGEYITGLWTQRSALRDAAVPYLQAKFYSAGRYDSLWDGLNLELTAKLTMGRRAGASVYNNQTWPTIKRFGGFKPLVNGVEQVWVMVDTAGAVYDGTGPSTQLNIWNKSAGAGSTYFQQVGNSLYFSNGVDNKKWVVGPYTWQASKAVQPGALINQGANPGTIYMALGGMSLAVVGTSVSGSGGTWRHLVYVNQAQVPINFTNLVGARVTFSGLTTDTTLNGQTLTVDTILSTTLGIFQVTTATGAAQAYAVDTGTATTGSGTTAGSIPSFNPARLTVTQDGGQQWKSYGGAVQNWGLTAPTVPPTLTADALSRFWQPNTAFPLYTSLLDSNGNIEVVAATSGTNSSGPVYPTWGVAAAAAQLVATNLTAAPVALSNVFGTVYQNMSSNIELHTGWGTVVGGSAVAYFELMIGPTNPPTMNTWGTTFTGTSKAGTGSNGKLGFAFSVPPSWYYEMQAFGDVSPTPGGWDGTPLVPTATGVSTPGGADSVTTDGGLTWYNLGQPGAWQADATNAGLNGTCLIDSNGNLQWLYSGGGGTSGATVPAWGTTLTWLCISVGGSGSLLSYQTVKYAYSLHAIDASVSTASPPAIVFGGVLGTSALYTQILGMTATSPGLFADGQIDQVWIWRTAQGGSTLILEDQLPSDGLTNSFTYTEIGIPDTSARGGASLNALISAPIASQNNPPPVGMTALQYHEGRTWGAVGNQLFFSTGPDVGGGGNGNTAWSPGSVFGLPELITRMEDVTLSNGALLAVTTSNWYAVFGNGTASNPFYVSTYYKSCGLLSYDAMDVVGSTFYLLNNKGKMVSLDPSAGYVEVGFPIGDQFKRVTTGGINATLYTPGTAYVSWYENGSGDTGLYVADGAVGWFRYSPVTSPESGSVWSPRAAIAGGTSAVQKVETSPGIESLLIGPAAAGPILTRDIATNADNGANFAAPYATLGSIMLAQPGEIAEVAFVSLISTKVGTAPVVGLLFDEINPTATTAFDMLPMSVTEPPDLKSAPSETLFMERFSALQGNVAPKCLHMQMLIQFAQENVPSELLLHAVFGAKRGERRVTEDR
jgi:hypothetical protein